MNFAPWQQTGKTKHGVAKPTDCAQGHRHDSKREAARCGLLHIRQLAGEIHGLQSQPFYPFVINGNQLKMANGHDGGVTLDFSYVEAGALVAEDVKGRSKLADSRDWPLRKALFKHLYPATDLREVRS